MQAPIDSLKKAQKEYVPKIYPFNPNFITDFKGYNQWTKDAKKYS